MNNICNFSSLEFVDWLGDSVKPGVLSGVFRDGFRVREVPAHA